jgi:hypothetical protein
LIAPKNGWRHIEAFLHRYRDEKQLVEKASPQTGVPPTGEDGDD